MANIVISFVTCYGDSFYKNLSNELIKNGNNVYFVNWYNLVQKIEGQDMLKPQKQFMVNKILDFKPDVIFNFNFSLPVEILDKVQAKICIIDADSPEVFVNFDLFKEYANKKDFYYAGFQSCDKELYEQAINKTIVADRYKYIPMATNFQKRDVEYQRGIAFLGSNWYGAYLNGYSEEVIKGFKYLYQKYKQNIQLDWAKEWEQYKIDNDLKTNVTVNNMLSLHFLGQKRIKFLSVLSDLGLEIYGPNWNMISNFVDIDLGLCVKGGGIYGQENVEEFYNSSKICLNCSCDAAINGFSFRVMDIMATNACILTEEKNDFHLLFDKYLSQETINAVLYKDRYDLREKAKRLLSDEDLCKRCVHELNNAIEQNGRWKHRIQSFEDFLGVKLLNISNDNPIFIDASKESVIEQNQAEQKTKNKQYHFDLKRRLKLIYYSLLLFISQIPIIELTMPRKKRDYLLKEIEKYWR